MLAAVVDTGDVSVVAKEGLLESSLSLCSWINKGRLITCLIYTTADLSKHVTYPL